MKSGPISVSNYISVCELRVLCRTSFLNPKVSLWEDARRVICKEAV